MDLPRKNVYNSNSRLKKSICSLQNTHQSASSLGEDDFWWRSSEGDNKTLELAELLFLSMHHSHHVPEKQTT